MPVVLSPVQPSPIPVHSSGLVRGKNARDTDSEFSLCLSSWRTGLLLPHNTEATAQFPTLPKRCLATSGYYQIYSIDRIYGIRYISSHEYIPRISFFRSSPFHPASLPAVAARAPGTLRLRTHPCDRSRPTQYLASPRTTARGQAGERPPTGAVDPLPDQPRPTPMGDKSFAANGQWREPNRAVCRRPGCARRHAEPARRPSLRLMASFMGMSAT